MIAAVEAARKDGNSLGGIVTCVARGCPPGWGEPVFDRLEADLARAMLSLPATKGFEIGSGFAGTDLTGLEHNDTFYMDGDRVRTRTQSQRRRAGRHHQRRGGVLPGRVQADRDGDARAGDGERRRARTPPSPAGGATIPACCRAPCRWWRRWPPWCSWTTRFATTRSGPADDGAARPGGAGLPRPCWSARPPIRPHDRGSAAAARRRGSVADGDAIAQALVELVADALHLAQVVGLAKGSLARCSTMACAFDGPMPGRVASSSDDAVLMLTRPPGPDSTAPALPPERAGARRGAPTAAFLRSHHLVLLPGASAGAVPDANRNPRTSARSPRNCAENRARPSAGCNVACNAFVAASGASFPFGSGCVTPPSRTSAGICTGCSSAWLEHCVRDAGVAGSNPVTPTITRTTSRQ